METDSEITEISPLKLCTTTIYTLYNLFFFLVGLSGPEPISFLLLYSLVKRQLLQAAHKPLKKTSRRNIESEAGNIRVEASSNRFIKAERSLFHLTGAMMTYNTL